MYAISPQIYKLPIDFDAFKQTFPQFAKRVLHLQFYYKCNLYRPVSGFVDFFGINGCFINTSAG